MTASDLTPHQESILLRLLPRGAGSIQVPFINQAHAELDLRGLIMTTESPGYCGIRLTEEGLETARRLREQTKTTGGEG